MNMFLFKNKFLVFWLLLFIITNFYYVQDIQAEGKPTALCNMIQAFADTVRYVGFGLVVIFTIIAGIMFASSQGRPDALNSAKQALIAIIIGIALIVASYSTSAIIKELFGKDITTCWIKPLSPSI